MESELVKFPLNGDWVAYHTPADKVPTHGTDVMGMRYAYDILKINWKEKGIKFYKSSNVSYWLKGVKLEECLAYGETLCSPFSGVVVDAYSEYPERRWLHPITDFILGHGKSIKFIFATAPEKNGELIPIIGNYIIIKMMDKEIYALCAHLRKDSLKVVVGEKVESSQAIAQIGHSGNSTAPHLHFQLMDRADLMSAKGISCAFEEYEVFREGKWGKVREGIPEKLVPMRSCT